MRGREKKRGVVRESREKKRMVISISRGARPNYLSMCPTRFNTAYFDKGIAGKNAFEDIFEGIFKHLRRHLTCLTAPILRVPYVRL